MPRRTVVGSAGVIALASCLLCGPAFAQWAVGAEVGADRFWGGSIEKVGQHRSFRPYRPTTFAVSLQRTAGRFALGVRLGYSSAGLALEGADGLAAVNGVFEVYSLSPALRYHLATVGSTNHLMMQVGPLLEVWSMNEGSSETRVGAEAALSLSIPLGGGFAGSVRAGLALIPSPFETGQLDPSFERRPLWRRRVVAGVSYGL